MILPSFHLLIKQYRSSLFRTIVRRQLANLDIQKKNVKQQENDILLQSQTQQIEIATFTQKGTKIVFCRIEDRFSISISSTSGERDCLFSCGRRWCSSIRWIMLSNVT